MYTLTLAFMSEGYNAKEARNRCDVLRDKPATLHKLRKIIVQKTFGLNRPLGHVCVFMDENGTGHSFAFGPKRRPDGTPIPARQDKTRYLGLVNSPRHKNKAALLSIFSIACANMFNNWSGDVHDSPKHKPGAVATFALSEAEFYKALAFALETKKNPPSCRMGLSTCSLFATKVAEAAGINLPLLGNMDRIRISGDVLCAFQNMAFQMEQTERKTWKGSIDGRKVTVQFNDPSLAPGANLSRRPAGNYYTSPRSTSEPA